VPQLEKIELALFDLDGTLLNSQRGNRLVRDWSSVVTQAFHHARPIYHQLEIVEFVASRTGLKWPLVPDAQHILAELKNHGVKLGIVTDRSGLVAAPYFGQGLEFDPKDFVVIHTRQGPFDFLVPRICSHHSAHLGGKSSATFDAILDSLLASNGIAKERVVYVGDTVADFLATDGAGIKFFASSWGRASRETFRAFGLEDKFILGSLRDLIQLFD